MVDGEELYEGMEGLGGELRIAQTGTRQEISQRPQGGFDLRDGGGIGGDVCRVCLR
jgi:hypothetical protein